MAAWVVSSHGFCHKELVQVVDKVVSDVQCRPYITRETARDGFAWLLSFEMVEREDESHLPRFLGVGDVLEGG